MHDIRLTLYLMTVALLEKEKNYEKPHYVISKTVIRANVSSRANNLNIINSMVNCHVFTLMTSVTDALLVLL